MGSRRRFNPLAITPSRRCLYMVGDYKCLAPSLSLPLSIYTPSPPEKIRTRDTGLFPVVHATAGTAVVCRSHPPSFSELYRGGPSSLSLSPLILHDCSQSRPSHCQPSKSQQSLQFILSLQFFASFLCLFQLTPATFGPILCARCIVHHVIYLSLRFLASIDQCNHMNLAAKPPVGA